MNWVMNWVIVKIQPFLRHVGYSHLLFRNELESLLINSEDIDFRPASESFAPLSRQPTPSISKHSWIWGRTSKYQLIISETSDRCTKVQFIMLMGRVINRQKSFSDKNGGKRGQRP